MTLQLSDIPSRSAQPAHAAPSAVRRAVVRQAFPRRSVLKSIAVAGMTLGIASLDLLPTGSRAQAEPSTYLQCSAWLNSGTQEWLRCNPGGSVHGNVGAVFCNSVGYHRIDTVTGEFGIRTKFYRRHYSCTGNDGGRNAWVWRKNQQGNEPREVRCSDGRGVVRNRDGVVVNRYNSACRKWLSAS